MKLREKNEERRQLPQKCDRKNRSSLNGEIRNAKHIEQKEEKTRKNVFSLENICRNQKKVVILQAFSREIRNRTP